jgi:hypothetical protein
MSLVSNFGDWQLPLGLAMWKPSVILAKKMSVEARFKQPEKIKRNRGQELGQ